MAFKQGGCILCYVCLLQTLVTTAGVIEQAFKLYQHLPLPTIPSPDPHAISHIIVNRLHLTGSQSLHL